MPSPPTAVPAPTWRAVSRERHVAGTRDAAWAALDGRPLSPRVEADLSVEPPWRLVRSVAADEVERCEVAVTIRDDGGECHLAWSAGAATAGVDEPVLDALLDELATHGQALLTAVADAAEAADR